MLLPKLRTLANLKHTPAIVIADGTGADIKGDATILSHFRDPAVLIDTV